MSHDRFEARFVVRVDRAVAWERLTGGAERAVGDRVWLPGFDSEVTIGAVDGHERLEATKDDEPCAGTDIVVHLEDADGGTRITVTQSGFGDWMPPMRDVMDVGWRHIVADLTTHLATGVHAGRHLRPWGDLGAEVTSGPGGLWIDAVRPESLAADLGLLAGDLLVMLAGAPVAGHDDVTTVLRVLAAVAHDGIEAEVVRSGERQFLAA